MSFSDDRVDDALRDVLGWPIDQRPSTPATKLAELRDWLAVRRRLRAIDRAKKELSQ